MNNIISLFIVLAIAGSTSAEEAEGKAPLKKEYSAISDRYEISRTQTEPLYVTDLKEVVPQVNVRPNIIIVLADDLDAVYTPQYFPEVLPVVDSLTKVGIEMVNSFTPMSICCPSRSATLTGSYAHTNGVYRNAGINGGWKGFKHNEPHTLAAQLNNSGYRTAMIGKYLNGWGNKNAEPVYGWTDGSVIVSKDKAVYRGYDYELLNWSGGQVSNDSTWKTNQNDRKKYGETAADYSTDVLNEKAQAFLYDTEKNDDQPFFLYLAPTAPHIPLQAPQRYLEMSEERWMNTFKSPYPNFNNDFGKLATPKENKKPLDKSSFLRETWKKRVRKMDNGKFFYNLWQIGKAPKAVKGFLQADWNNRMGSLYALNDLVRNVIQTLQDKGEWENTLLIFTSDNGFMLGAHGMLHKGNPYEEAIRVPMVISGGDALHLRSPGKTEEWVTNLDIMPTILDLAGVNKPESVEGISLVPLLYNDSTTNLRDRFVMEYLGPGMATEGLVKHPRISLKVLPLIGLDQPSYHAIRMKITTNEAGVKQEKIYKYIEWQKYMTKKVLKFSDQYRLKDQYLMAKIAAGDKKTIQLKDKAEEVETELYDITEDPYEMDNLLYYKPEEYRELALQMKMAMREIILKK